MLSRVVRKLDKGKLHRAIKILSTNVLKRVDGCITGAAPEKNDLIRDCDLQEDVYNQVQAILLLLQETE